MAGSASLQSQSRKRGGNSLLWWLSSRVRQSTQRLPLLEDVHSWTRDKTVATSSGDVASIVEEVGYTEQSSQIMDREIRVHSSWSQRIPEEPLVRVSTPMGQMHDIVKHMKLHKASIIPEQKVVPEEVPSDFFRRYAPERKTCLQRYLQAVIRPNKQDHTQNAAAAAIVLVVVIAVVTLVTIGCLQAITRGTEK